MKVISKIRFEGGTYQPGDWVKMNLPSVLAFYGRGEIVVGDEQALIPLDSGVLTPGPTNPPFAEQYGLPVSRGTKLDAVHTVVWDGVGIRDRVIPIGLQLLNRWDMVVPLQQDNMHYDTRLIFIKEFCDAQAIIQTVFGGEDFTQVLRRYTPMVLPVPGSWICTE